MDFTIEKYRELLVALKQHKTHRIKHDVDLRPEYALLVAQVEAEMDVQTTYYFRSMHFTSHAEVIKAIVALGHQAGYHYECLTTCRGDMEAAYKDFCLNLEKLRSIVPVSTACAHGSPRSPYNSQELFEGSNSQIAKKPNSQPQSLTAYDIHALGIDFEPMLDTDFSQTLYLTDTGRRWDGYHVSVRDKVPEYQERWEQEGLIFHSTDDIIHALNDPHHPIQRKALLINTHPQRWMPFGWAWLQEAVLQNAKNLVKGMIADGFLT